ncbi:ABC transporter substrate-binding protein [Agarivorans sp. 2_MG-2023]|uniref:substrate-binding periplasmic protein n=1 Tax=Agarivorans sp. 2_MG-2023 TaxID=3062647 RepID=UPI0026E11DDD|nr:transporter substrate-binding domain-containing protein [Agarivorans sp. 2_MG-2023]
MSSSLCLAKDNVILIGVADFPPYSIVEGDKFSGAEVDIVRESLTIAGYQVEFTSYPYGRLPISFRQKQIDGAIVTLKNFKDIEVFYSDIVLPEYQTVAIHLNKTDLDISTINDLQDKSILAHQRASLFYGDDYQRIALSNKEKSLYQETSKQQSQILMLFKERVDVIVLAHEIFNYFKARTEYKNTDTEYVVSKIFGEKFGFYNVFWDREVRDGFNRGLYIIKENGTYDRIVSQYLESQEPNPHQERFRDLE